MIRYPNQFMGGKGLPSILHRFFMDVRVRRLAAAPISTLALRLGHVDYLLMTAGRRSPALINLDDVVSFILKNRSAPLNIFTDGMIQFDEERNKLPKLTIIRDKS